MSVHRNTRRTECSSMTLTGERSTCKFSSYWIAMTTSARRLNPQDFLRVYEKFRLRRDLSLFPRPDQRVSSRFAGLSSVNSVWTPCAPVGEYGHRGGFQELPFP